MTRPQRRRWAGTPVGQPPSSGGTWGGRPGVETRRRGWVGRRSAGSPYSSPWPAPNPAQVGFSNRGLGPLRTRSVHGHYWPSPGHTPGWAPVSSKLRGRGGGVPRIPSEWCILGQRLNSDPVPVARGTACAGWPLLGHHALNPEPIPVRRAEICTELHRMTWTASWSGGSYKEIRVWLPRNGWNGGGVGDSFSEAETADV